MRFYCLINLKSGGRRGAALVKSLQVQETYNIDIHEIDFARIDEQVRTGLNHDCLIIGGGDGTVSRVLSLCRGHDTKIGIFPLGTGNDLAKELGIYRRFAVEHPDRLLEIYRTQPGKKFTLWELRYGESYEQAVVFCNYVSFGLDGKVVSEFSSWREKSGATQTLYEVTANRAKYLALFLKNASYRIPLSAVKLLAGTEPCNVSHNSCKNILFSNIRSCMGLGISNPASNPFDESLEALVCTSHLNYLSIITSHKLPLPRPTFLGSATEWKVEGLPTACPIQIDGESRFDISSSCYLIRPAGQVKIAVLPVVDRRDRE